jgi:hypothetical protein
VDICIKSEQHTCRLRTGLHMRAPGGRAGQWLCRDDRGVRGRAACRSSGRSGQRGIVGLQEATRAQKGRGRGEGPKEGMAEGSGCVVSVRVYVFLIGVCELSMLLWAERDSRGLRDWITL